MLKKLIGVGAIGLIVAVSIGCTTLATTPKKEITYIVESGDTLWSIAQKECPDESRDIREVIYEISERNHLDNGPLRVGTKLKLEVDE